MDKAIFPKTLLEQILVKFCKKVLQRNLGHI